jgi:uncharacterized protein DUF4412
VTFVFFVVSFSDADQGDVLRDQSGIRDQEIRVLIDSRVWHSEARMRRSMHLLAVLIAVSTPAWAEAKDLMLRLRTTITGKSEEAVQYWTTSKMVTDSPQLRTIIDLDAKTITRVTKKEKSYTTVTLDGARDLGKRRDWSEGSMGLPLRTTALDSTLTLTPTGRTEKIAGYEAKEYAIAGGNSSGSVYVTEALDLGPNAQAFKKVAADLGGPGRSGGRLIQELAKVKGLALRKSLVRTVGTQKISTQVEVVEIAAKSPPADIWKVPHGFKNVQIASQP